MKGKQQMTARKIAFSGLFIAISVILTRFFVGDLLIAGVYALRVSLGEIPIILGGVLMGPVYGALIGGLADLIGYPLKPLGPYFPGFTLTAALTGFIPGIFTRLYKKELTWAALLAMVTINDFFTSMVLNTLWLHMTTGKAFIVLLPTRILARIVMIPVYTVILKVLLKQFKNVAPLTR
jgi:ECF transporter S component (folate family)